MYSVPAQKYTVYTKNTYPISKHDHLLAAGLTEPISAQGRGPAGPVSVAAGPVYVAVGPDGTYICAGPRSCSPCPCSDRI